MASVIVYSGPDEWSALYIDGKLDQVGDTYLIDERIRSFFGVTTIYDEEYDYMQGQNTREGVASTIAEVEQYKYRRLIAEERAAELRAQADELIRQAKEIKP